MVLEVVGIVGQIGYALLENLQAGLLVGFMVVGTVVGPAEDLFVVGC